MTLLIAVPSRQQDVWGRAFKRSTLEFEVRIWPDSGNPADIDFVVAWETPPGFFGRFPNLKCIASLGAGVDNLIERGY
jgi:glyoxylate/hydroxypyruvate reductase A